jgi:flagellar hook-length control protein FliK
MEQLSSRAANRTPVQPQFSEAERARFVQRVAGAFQAAEDGGGQVRLRLSPPELGALRLDVTLRAGVLSAHLEAETPQARTLLLDSLPALRERLAEHNIKVDRFEVDLMNQSSGGSPHGFAGRDSSPESDANKLRPRPAAETNAEPAAAGTSPRRPGGGQLNVVI